MISRDGCEPGYGRQDVRTPFHATLCLGLILSALSAACGGSSRSGGAPTFARDVAPIVFTSCAPCHRPGGVAPFSLLTYKDAASHAKEIAEQTEARHMPPWMPEPGQFPIVGERRLSAQQIETIQSWVKNGTPEGNPAELPKPPTFTGGWELGKPDATLAPAVAYPLKPATEDVYRNLVIRTSLPSDVYVRAVEFRTNGAPVHHAVIRADRSGVSHRRDGVDGQPGFDGMNWQNAQDPDGQFIGWSPGRGPIVAPEGMPWRLERGADLVIELHLIPGPQATPVKPTIGLFLTSAAPARTPLTVRMGSKLIDIPAGASQHLVTDEYELPVDVELLSVYPHAHYLGKEMLATATFPDGAEHTLLHIRHWQFHWQQDYRYVTPIRLPRGTKLRMRYTYDNSAGNPANPRRPPVRVKIGPKSTDEMAELGLQLLPASAADASRLAQSFVERDMLANIALGEQKAREEPQNAEYRAFLGGAYVEVGRFADAIPHLEAALRLDPKSGNAHSDLGTSLMEMNRLPEALAHFRAAAAFSPRDENIQFNLGNALSRARRLPDAAAAYERAIAINPGFPDAHVNLGSLRFSQGRVKEALPHFERAAALMPSSAVIRSNLANALAVNGRYKEALEQVRVALSLSPDYAPAQETLKRLNQLGIR
jgi:tetratricopeptide (TPR) repeat protein